MTSQDLARNSSDELWRCIQYTKDNRRALIGLALEPGATHETYSVTILGPNSEELYARDFPRPEQALQHLEQRCLGWKKKDIRQKEGTGCSSCVAH